MCNMRQEGPWTLPPGSPGDPVVCRDLVDMTVEVAGTFTGTVKVMLKVSTKFLEVASTSTEDILAVPQIGLAICVDTSGVLTGSVVCSLVAMQGRSDG